MSGGNLEMKKRIRKRPPDEIKMIENKKFDDMQNGGMTPEQRKAWDRKPYQVGDKNDRTR